MPETDDLALARRAIALLDLTDLTDDCSDAAIRALCAKAAWEKGRVAAVCVWPQFVPLAKELLAGTGVRVATVINFPDGGTDIERACDDTREALGDGADEIDLVMPYRAFLAGDAKGAKEMIAAVREEIGGKGLLKVILETGSYPDAASVRRASDIAIAAGADFIKTSTGKTAVSATPEAVEAMLAAIHESRRRVGLKPSGGIRTLADARAYLALADRIMGPDWATPATFRFGASGLHGALAAVIENKAAPQAGAPGTY